MVRPIAFAALMLCAAPSFAAVAPMSDGFLAPSHLEALAAIKAAAPQWTNVSLTIGNMPGFVSINEPSLRVSVNGSRSGAGAYFSGFAGNDSLNFSVGSFGSGWTLYGSGVNVTVSPFGDGYTVWGSVGKTSVNFTINRFGSGLSVWGQSGANLSVGGWGSNLQVYGQIDETRFSRQALAVMGATLALAAPVAK